MDKQLTLRLQTRNGMKRISVSPKIMVSALKKEIEILHTIPSSEQTLSIRNGTVTQKLDEKAQLFTYGLKDDDLVIVMSQNIEKSASDADKATVSRITNTGEVVKDVQKEQTSVIEDEIDQFLHKEDGWTVKDNAKKGYRTPDDYIAPWNVQQHPKCADLKIKHLPFHSWVREKAYRSGSNTQTPLVQDSFKVAKRGQLTSTDLSQSTVTITGQPYRHVDSVLFEHKQVLEPFIDRWRRTGLQRCGYLIGKYVPDEGIPLGITARVSAIYEPPQTVVEPPPDSTAGTDAQLLKDPNSDEVDALLKSLGLTRVGFIWTHFRLNEAKKLISDRDPSSPLEAQEMTRMAHLQLRYPNPWNNSREGHFGSKFVSVLLTGGKDHDNVEIEAYQMSNQGVSLVKDKIIKPSKNNQTQFRVATSNDQWLYPDILYKEKDEYGNVIVKKADPFFPCNFFVISVRHGFPKDPKPTFKSYQFPIENNPLTIETVMWQLVQRHLEGKRGTDFINALNDFHLLYFLATAEGLNKEIAEVVVSLLKNPSPKESDIAIVRDVLGIVIQSFLPSTKPPSKVNMQFLNDLLVMGFEEIAAQEALVATGNTSVQAATNYLLR